MTLFIIIISFSLTLAAAYFSSMSMRSRSRALIFTVYLFLYALIFPVFLWLPVYFNVDFSKEDVFPAGFKDRIYLNRVNESKKLPINNNGLIADTDYEPGVSGKRRIIILGDSFAAGFGLGYPETLGAHLQSLAGNEYEVINGAFYGTNTEMQVDYFCNHLLKYKPDVVIIRHRMDDVMPLKEKYYLELTAGIIRKYAPHWPRPVRDVFFRFETLLIRNKFWAYYRANTREVIKDNMSNFFEMLNRHTSEEGIRVLMIRDKCLPDYEAVCEAADAAAANYGWELLDPHKTIDFSAPDMIIPGDGHPSALANRVLADFIFGKLRDTH
ncbi:MAG TPA: SGNH/GDSL hydrolase family protein [bacterium]|nr:SGNH/GDSL hydrolase family protein [bacterium]